MEPTLGPAVIRGMELPYEVVDGLAVHDGHIILGKAEEVARWTADGTLRPSGRSPGIQYAVTSGYRSSGLFCTWPDGIVPYLIDDNVPGRDRILRAVREWDSKTVLRFVERTPQHKDYLRFASGSVSGTWICTGDSPGEQVLQIESGGSSYEVILHGIGHLIGFENEQQRRDRDRYVSVFSDNIAATPDARNAWHWRWWFGRDIGPFDYRSIMTYPAFDSDNQRNHARYALMETIPPGMPLGGEAQTGLSPGDVDSTARLYGHIPSRHVISTNPSGLEIIVDGERMTAPASFAWEPGSEHTLEVPSPQFRPGSRFLFGRWSDDGDRVHRITATPRNNAAPGKLHRATPGVGHSRSTRSGQRRRQSRESGWVLHVALADRTVGDAEAGQ